MKIIDKRNAETLMPGELERGKVYRRVDAGYDVGRAVEENVWLVTDERTLVRIHDGYELGQDTDGTRRFVEIQGHFEITGG